MTNQRHDLLIFGEKSGYGASRCGGAHTWRCITDETERSRDGRVMMGWKGDAMRKDDVRQGKPPISILLIQGTNPNAGSRLWLQTPTGVGFWFLQWCNHVSCGYVGRWKRFLLYNWRNYYHHIMVTENAMQREEASWRVSLRLGGVICPW